MEKTLSPLLHVKIICDIDVVCEDTLNLFVYLENTVLVYIPREFIQWVFNVLFSG